MPSTSIYRSQLISSDFVNMDIQDFPRDIDVRILVKIQAREPQIDFSDTRILVGEWKKCKALQDLVAEATEYMGRTLLHKHEATDFKLRLSEAIWYYSDLFSDRDTPHWASAFHITLLL